MSSPAEREDAPVPLPITGEPDLPAFRPADLGELIPADLAACAARNLREVRLVHGQGAGPLRTTVPALLRRSPLVKSFRPGDGPTGSWGATIATLHR